MYAHEDSEWRYAVRDLRETDRNNTTIDTRVAAGLNGYSEAGDDE